MLKSFRALSASDLQELAVLAPFPAPCEPHREMQPGTPSMKHPEKHPSRASALASAREGRTAQTGDGSPSGFRALRNEVAANPSLAFEEEPGSMTPPRRSVVPKSGRFPDLSAMAYEFLHSVARASSTARRGDETMKVLKNGALALLPVAGILFASLTACSGGGTTAPSTTQTSGDQEHSVLRVDPPPIEDGGDGGSAPPPSDDDGSGGAKDGSPPTSEDTFGDNND